MKYKRAISTYYKYFLIIAALCLALICIFFCTDTCYAESSKDAEDILEENVDENLSKLDIKSLQELFESLDKDFQTLFGEDVATTLKGIIKGDFKGDFSQFLSVLAKGIGKCILDVLPMTLTIVAIAVMYSLLDYHLFQ